MIARGRKRIAPDLTACRYCGAELHPWRDPEPDDEPICGPCEDRREDCARDDAADRAREERWHDGY
jgi:hypothetical protein